MHHSTLSLTTDQARQGERWRVEAPGRLLAVAPVGPQAEVVAGADLVVVRSRAGAPGAGWLAVGEWESLAVAWEQRVPADRLAVEPWHCDAVSDVPSTLGFLRARPPWRLVLNPAAMLAPSMLPRAEEHLERIADVLAGHPRLAGVIVPAAGPLGTMVKRVVLPLVGAGAWVARAAEERLVGVGLQSPDAPETP
jgi:hypothetical protein